MSASSETASVNGGAAWRAWGYWIAAQRGILIAIAIFVAMFAVYGWKQEVGLTASIVNTAANKGALLALVAMAQTIPVLTGGLDLSVGMIFMLTNCLASTIVNGSPLMTALGIVGVLAVGLLCGIVNGAYRRLRPPAADHRHARHRRDLFRRRPCAPSGAGRLGELRGRRLS